MKTILRIVAICIGIIVVAGIIIVALFYRNWHSKMDELGMSEQWDDSLGVAVRNLQYGADAAQAYDLFIPHQATQGDTLPLMLFVHGGSWMGGDKGEGEFTCCNAARGGYLSATMNYRLLSKESDASISSMLDDIEQCVAHVRNEALRRGYPIGQMSIGGISAGGHLSLLYAYSRAAQSPIPIAFVVDRVGPADLRILFPVTEENADTEDSHQLVRSVSGREWNGRLTKQTVDSILAAASPVSYVDSTTVPTLMAYGAQDGLVTPAHADTLAHALSVHGVAHQLFMFPNSNHALFDDPDQTKRFHQAINQYAKTYFAK